MKTYVVTAVSQDLETVKEEVIAKTSTEAMMKFLQKFGMNFAKMAVSRA